MEAPSEVPRLAPDAPGVAARGLLARPATWLVLSVVVLGVSLWAVSLQRTHGFLPRDFKGTLNYPLTVGGYVVETRRALDFAVQTFPPGTRLELGAAVPPVVLPPDVDLAEWVLAFVSVFFYWAVCAFGLAPRAGLSAARHMYICLVLVMLAIAVGSVYPPVAPGETVLALLDVVALALLPSAFVLLTLHFPRRSSVLARHRWLPAGVWLPGMIVAVWGSAAWLAHFDERTPATWAATRAPETVADLLLVLGMGLGIVILAVTYRRATVERERAQTKWLVWGIAVAAAPFVCLRVVPRLLFDVWLPLTPAVDRAIELAAPAAIAIAVARHRLFDVDLIIRRSVIYTVLALLLAGAAVFVLLLLDPGHAVTSGLPREVVWLLAGAVPAALFVPLRRAVRTWVDRTLFQIRHVHAQALRALDLPLQNAADQTEVAAVLRRFLDEALRPKAAAALVLADAERLVDGSFAADVRQAPDDLTGMHPEAGIALAHAGASTLPEIEVASLPARLAAAGVVLVQPIARRGRLLGLLLLGEKISERRYVEEDLGLLAAAAGRAAQTLERLALVQSVAQESVARRGLAELHRQKSDFLLRVAHDLRTPLTAVRWTVDNLLDGLSGPLTPRQSEDLTPVRAATGQLGRMIDNVLAISRMELGADRIACGPVDLSTVAREALTATGPQAAAKGVRLVLHADPDLPPAHGQRDALFEVALNLVDNAVKYAPPGTEVEVLVRPEPDLGLALAVRDHGPGLGATDPERLFDLFRQGAASPHSAAKGFGVGLYVVRSWVESLGGTVGAGNASDGGAVFTCRLKCWAGTGANA